jgi:hypothetical protein
MHHSLISGDQWQATTQPARIFHPPSRQDTDQCIQIRLRQLRARPTRARSRQIRNRSLIHPIRLLHAAGVVLPPHRRAERCRRVQLTRRARRRPATAAPHRRHRLHRRLWSRCCRRRGWARSRARSRCHRRSRRNRRLRRTRTHRADCRDTGDAMDLHSLASGTR